EALDLDGATDDHRRAIVDRVVERRAGQHQTVDQRHGDAHVDTRRERSQHAAGGRTVDVEVVTDPPVRGGDHERTVLGDEADVAHDALVEDRVEGGAVVAGPLGKPADGGVGGRLDARDGTEPSPDVL